MTKEEAKKIVTDKHPDYKIGKMAYFSGYKLIAILRPFDGKWWPIGDHCKNESAAWISAAWAIYRENKKQSEQK